MPVQACNFFPAEENSVVSHPQSPLVWRHRKHLFDQVGKKTVSNGIAVPVTFIGEKILVKALTESAPAFSAETGNALYAYSRLIDLR